MPPPPQSIANVVVTAASLPDTLSGRSAEGEILRSESVEVSPSPVYGARLLSGLGV